ncbi:hypothetical protein DFH06DRAFT_1020 [Mycena polygramma]|nr:hypothetical protein DFH06DRAFT_1020 [Mycena polygramma]
MAALESQMSILRKEHHDVMEELAGVVYPVLTLPNEIACEIFSQYVGSYVMLTRYSSYDSPLRLASVCSSWRALALSHCSLWTHLDSGWRRDDATRLTNLLRIWLPRAGGLPLHLKIALPKTQADCVLRIVGQYSAQWQNLKLNSRGPISFPHDIRGPFPSLTKLHLRSPYAEGVSILPAISNAAHLREVDLVSIYPENWRSIPWSQLTRLNLSDFKIDTCLDILAHASNLEALNFICGMPNSGPPLAVSLPLILPHLHTIRVVGEYGAELLDYLALPALDVLSLQLTNESTEQISGMVTRSGCTPRSLIFYTYDPAFEQIYRCMTMVPWLRALEMAYLAGSAADYHLFFETLAQGSILPALESLQITDCGPEIALPTLVRMLKARTTDTDGLAKLQSFSLLFEDDGDHEPGINGAKRDARVEDALATLHEMRSQGLKVDIKSKIKWLSQNISSQIIREIGEEER